MQETSDKNGETERYTYDALGRLIRKTYDGLTGVYGYTYNADGIRTSVANGTSVTYFEQDGSRIRYRKAGNELTQFLYDDRDSVLGMVWNGQTYFFKKNLQGDVVSLLHGDGTVAGTYTYDAWGKGKIASYDSLSDLTVMALNPFRYRGYYYDNETGLYYVNSRYYDPEVGRWINADGQLTIGDDITGLNLFVYCGNNPIMRVDSSGHAWWHWALGAVIVAACAVATVVTCGGFAAAATAVCLVGNGIAAATTASTVAAAALIGSATAYGAATFVAAASSGSVEEFCDQGNWGTVAATAGGAVLGGVGGYQTSKAQTPTSTPTNTSRDSTGKTEPANLREKLAMEQVKSNPSAGTPLTKITLNEPRWPSSEGWVKMQQIVPTSQGNINIHYVYNQT